MSLSGFLLVMAAAFSHAIWNFLIKRVNGGPELICLFSAISIVLYAPAVLYVLSGQQFRFGPLEIVFIIGSALLHLGYFLLLQAGYRRGDLSLVYPTARATGPLLATALAVVLLGENLTDRIAVGAVTLIAGVIGLTGGLRANSGRLNVSLAFGLGAGTLIGSYTVWDAFAVSSLLVPPLLLEYVSAIARVVLLAPLAYRRRALAIGHLRQHCFSVLAIAVFNPLAYILVLYAMTFTPVVYVAPLREVSVLLTVLAGSLFLGEGSLRHRLGWALVILCGVGLLTAG